MTVYQSGSEPTCSNIRGDNLIFRKILWCTSSRERSRWDGKGVERKVSIKSKGRLEAFRTLVWYVEVLGKFPEIDRGRCKVVEGCEAKRGRGIG